MANWIAGVRDRAIGRLAAAFQKSYSTSYNLNHLFATGQPLPSGTSSAAAYETSWVAYSCIKRLATDAAGIPMVVLSDPEDMDSVVANSHPLANLLKYPSPHFSSSEFVQWIVTWLNLRGEFFITFDEPENPKQMFFWSDPQSWRETTQGGFVSLWEYVLNGQRLQVAPINVMQHRYINPSNPWRGQSPIQAATKAYSIDTGADTLQEDIISRGGERSVLYKSSADLQVHQRDQALAQLRARRAGDSKAAKDVLLPNGIEVINPQFIEDDLSILESQKLQPEKICAVYGLSRSLLGVEAIDQFSTFKSRVKVYFTQTMIPMLNGIEGSFDRYFNGSMTSKWHGYVRFDLAKVDALADDMVSKFTAASVAHAAGLPWTVCNERFDLGLDLDDIPGAGAVLVSAGLVPVESVINAWENPEPEPEPDDDDDQSDAPTAAPPAGPTKQLTLAADRVPVSARQAEITKRAIDTRSNLQRSVRLIRLERGLQQDWRKMMGVAARKTAAAVASASTPAQVRAAVKDGMAGLSERAVTMIRKAHEQAAREGARAMVEIAQGKMADAELEVWKARAPWRPGVADFIGQRENLIKGMIDEDLFGDIVAAASEAVTAGTESSALVELVAQRFAHGPGGTTRAVTIARTEVGSAYSVARHEEMKGQGFERHQWLTAGDELVRDGSEPGEFNHDKCNGETRAVDGSEGPFSCGLDYPMQAGGEAGNVINCRCETIPLVAGME